MTSTDSTTDLPQSGVVTYPITLNVNIDLDQDEQFRGFDAETREAAIRFASVAIASRGREIFEAHRYNTVEAADVSAEDTEALEGVLALRDLLNSLGIDATEVTA